MFQMIFILKILSQILILGRCRGIHDRVPFFDKIVPFFRHGEVSFTVDEYVFIDVPKTEQMAGGRDGKSEIDRVDQFL